MGAVKAMVSLNDKPVRAIRQVGSVNALTDVTGELAVVAYGPG